MNYNLTTYLLYSLIMFTIILRVGLICHRNGLAFILDVIHEETIGKRINNLLLTGYYLVNLGYVLYSIQDWEILSTSNQIIEALAAHISTLLLLLGILHFFNIFFITKILPQFIKS